MVVVKFVGCPTSSPFNPPLSVVHYLHVALRRSDSSRCCTRTLGNMNTSIACSIAERSLKCPPRRVGRDPRQVTTGPMRLGTTFAGSSCGTFTVKPIASALDSLTLPLAMWKLTELMKRSIHGKILQKQMFSSDAATISTILMRASPGAPASFDSGTATNDASFSSVLHNFVHHRRCGFYFWSCPCWPQLWRLRPGPAMATACAPSPKSTICGAESF